MPTSDWQQLLSQSGVRDVSASDVIREAVATIASPVTNSGSLSSANAGANSTAVLQPAPNSEIAQQISSLAGQISGLNATQQAAITAIQGNTQAVSQNTSSKDTGSSVAGQAVGVAESLLGGALSLSPIISGIMSLFGGGHSAPAPALTPFVLPAPVQYEAGVSAASGAVAMPVNYGQGGQPRAQSAPAAAQITVEVNAMDSRSFLDHSDDIANAVRAALLNSNGLSDVIAAL